MADNVIPLFGLELHDVPIEDILEKAKLWDMKEGLVIGLNDKGELQFGGNTSDGAIIAWILQLGLQQILNSHIGRTP